MSMGEHIVIHHQGAGEHQRFCIVFASAERQNSLPESDEDTKSSMKRHFEGFIGLEHIITPQPEVQRNLSNKKVHKKGNTILYNSIPNCLMEKIQSCPTWSRRGLSENHRRKLEKTD